jgi:hypothetical protein
MSLGKGDELVGAIHEIATTRRPAKEAQQINCIVCKWRK